MTRDEHSKIVKEIRADHARAVKLLEFRNGQRADRVKELNERNSALAERLSECLRILGDLENRGVINLGLDFFKDKTS